MHQTCDLDSSFSFSSHTAFNELRRDINIFSNKLKRVLSINLTCLCEEALKLVQWKLELEGTALGQIYVFIKTYAS